MGVDGLEKTEGDPDVDGDYVQVRLDPAVKQWSKNCPRSEYHDFERVHIPRRDRRAQNIYGGACEYVCRVRACGGADERNSGTYPRRQRKMQVAGA
jgi:hypothetical protein